MKASIRARIARRTMLAPPRHLALALSSSALPTPIALDEEAEGRVERVTRRIKKATFTGKGDKEKVPDLYKEYVERIAGTLRRADAFVCVTPEYNHAPGPALLNLLDHFGGSLFAFKPSAIVSYSAGQWGGTRAAHALRPILSELGCPPVSAMVHVPKAHEVFADEAGAPRRDAERWRAYAARALAQLEWWAGAARAHRAVVDPTAASPALRGTPADRDAP